jgi:hypothetical protein
VVALGIGSVDKMEAKSEVNESIKPCIALSVEMENI